MKANVSFSLLGSNQLETDTACVLKLFGRRFVPGERVGSGAEEAVLFEDLTSTPPAPGAVEVLEIGEGELNGGKGTRWGRRPLVRR